MLQKLFTALTLVCLLAACHKHDQDVTPILTGPVTQKETNNWILDSMRYFYLWNEDLPSRADTSLTATVFFAQLKNKADRFSYIYNLKDPGTYPQYMLYRYGLDFDIIPWPAAPGGVIGVVKLVMPGSLAEISGFHRGTYFTRLNGTILNSSNAASLGNAVLHTGPAIFTLATIQSNTVTEGEAVTLPAQTLAERPIYANTTFRAGGKTVAYLFYNHFDDTYSTVMQTAFQLFKTAGATELILDLRYNPGGSVAAAALLNALIAPGVNAQTVFAQYSGNQRLGKRNVSYQDALSAPETGTPVAYSSLSAARLNLKRVFILSGPGTTSAAELTINSLKPYIQVIQIGQTTFGKDKGAVIISGARIPWIIVPITYNLLNAKGEGGYTQGIAPQYAVDEMSIQPLYALGDTKDPLIAKALSVINGNGKQGRTPALIRHLYDSREIVAEESMLIVPR